jgi:hypothetical protein
VPQQQQHQHQRQQNDEQQRQQWRGHDPPQQQIGAARLAAAAAAAAAVVLGPWCVPPSAQAVTNEQLLFLEAWRAVDRAYVDKSFNGQNWFKVRCGGCAGSCAAAGVDQRAARWPAP